MTIASPTLRRGFTLLELMLTMGLLSFVLLSARLLLSTVVDTRTVIARDAARADSLRNGEQIARLLVESAESAPDSSELFVGNELNVDFTSWCRVGPGWLERCRVTFLLDHRQDSTALVAHFSANDEVELLRRPGTAVFRYLDRAAADTAWFDNWGSNVLLPDAVAIVSSTDTVVFISGGHGG